MRSPIRTLLAFLIAPALLIGLSAGAASGASPTLVSGLSGEKVATAEGRGGAAGTGRLTATRKGNRFCYQASVSGLELESGQSIRLWVGRGTSTQTGRLLFQLRPAPTASKTTAEGCHTAVKGLLDSIFSKPGGYYVAVFTTAPKSDSSGAALRGQLRKR